jgi:hypothetical protein
MPEILVIDGRILSSTQTQPTMPSPSTNPQTILFLAANPKDTDRRRLEQELRDIAEGLQRAQKRDQFKLEQRWAVRSRDIQRAMLDEGPQIVHFSGHGFGELGLLFEDESGNSKLVDGAALAGLFKLFADKITCVLLNGCYSEVQAQAIAQHIPYVIGMNQAIGEKAAIAFAVGFYDALGAGRDVEFAYNLGCAAIRLEGIAEHLTPTLLKQASGTTAPPKPDVPQLEIMPRSQLNPGSSAENDGQSELPQTKSPFITGIPIARPRDFFGRERQLKRLFNLLKSHPLQNAAIIGAKRSGKTSLLNYLRTITTTSPAQLRQGQRTDWLPNPQCYRWIFVDFQDARMVKREGLLSYLLESMQLPVPDPCDLERFMDQVSENVKLFTVILMDEIGVALDLQRCSELDDQFWESLRSVASNQTEGNLAFILASPENPIDLARQTGHTSSFFNIFGYTTTLGSLTETEAFQLIASSPIPLSEEDCTWILEQSHCYPLLLQILCRERLFSLEEGDSSDAWQAEGLRQLDPFRHLLNLP